MQNTTLKSAVALLCMWTVCNLQASTMNNLSSGYHAGQGTSQAIGIANHKYSGVPINGSQLAHLSGRLQNYIDAARKDGTLKMHEGLILKTKSASALLNNSEAANTAVYQRMHENGWRGTQSEVSSASARFTREQRQALLTRIKKEGLEPTLQDGVKALDALSRAYIHAEMNVANAHLTYSAYHPGSAAEMFLVNLDYDCQTMEGSFLAILAIGAVSSLGGINPLGDLLGAIGAVGEFATYMYCNW